MADIWEYIANYNPHGFYEDNRAKMLQNDINTARLGAINRENSLENTILELKNRVANGDKSALKPLGVYSPETTKKYIDNEEEMLNIARPYAQAILRMAPENREKGYQQMLKSLPNVDTSDMPDYYDENMIMLLANSDPQKLRDERLNEMAQENATIAYGRDLNKLQIASDLMEQRSQNAFNRDIQKLQYAYDRADQKTKEGIDFITSQVREGNIDRNAAITAAGKLLGVDLAIKSESEKLAEDYITGNMTPEEENAFLTRRKALTNATSTKATNRTAAQELKDLYGAGYSPESILKFSQSGDINDLEARPIQGGSIAADVQKYNMYNQEKDRLEKEYDRPLNETEDLGLQSRLGISSQELKNGELAVKHGFKMEEIGAQTQGKLENTTLQGKNAIDLENLRQGNRITMADVNQANAEKLENLKQQNRVALKFIDDGISKGKELRDLNNAKSLAEFKNALPTNEKLRYIELAKQMTEQGMPTTAEELALNDYNNALKTAEIERQYKQAQTEKAQREKQTELQQNAQWLVDNGVAPGLAEAVTMLKSKGNAPLGKAGDVVNGVTLTGYPKYDEELLKEKAKQDIEDRKNQQFIKDQAVKLKPILKEAYKAAKDGSGIGIVAGNTSRVLATEKGAKNIAKINTLKNMVGPAMIAQLKAAGAGARSFDSEGERQTYLPDFSVTQNADVLAQTIKEFADKMLDIKL